MGINLLISQEYQEKGVELLLFTKQICNGNVLGLLTLIVLFHSNTFKVDWLQILW